MLVSTTTQELLRNAADLMGTGELANVLGAPQSLVEAWMSGQATMPFDKVLLLLDVLEQLDRRSP